MGARPPKRRTSAQRRRPVAAGPDLRLHGRRPPRRQPGGTTVPTDQDGPGLPNKLASGNDDEAWSWSGLTAPPGPADPGEGADTYRRDALRAALLSAAAPWLAPSLPELAKAADGLTGRLPAAVVPTVAQIVASAQRMDDQYGGAARAYVADQYDALYRMLRRDTYDAVTGQKLSSLLSQLAQTEAFMIYDAGDDARAQRWYLDALHAARHAADRPLQASILSLMSNQAATRGLTADALNLADAANRAARTAPPTVRALTAARGTLAHAAAGDNTQLQRAHERAAELLSSPGSAEPAPRWAYYVSGGELDAIAGRAMVILGRKLPGPRPKILDRAKELLRGRALAHEPAFHRSELRHSAWLALAHIKAGELEPALQAGTRAIGLLPDVSSARSLGLLRLLRSDLTAYAGQPSADALARQLDTRPIPGGRIPGGSPSPA